ncbi:hypothetical protein ACHAXA_004047 [Cyclostephanos tholiformis]|uniref:Uncharacterized protein n=1 Tax=Cyclostephanos tholiformis TaxID=382380 RepID=A0ABD3R6B5_9STRA
MSHGKVMENSSRQIVSEETNLCSDLVMKRWKGNEGEKQADNDPGTKIMERHISSFKGVTMRFRMKQELWVSVHLVTDIALRE